jgi:hypothetical protein
MSVPEDQKIVILKSLQHYSDILASLLAEDTLPEIVKFDLNNEYAKLYKVQSIVQTQGIFQKINEDKSLSVLEIEEYANVIYSGLISYIKDLERSVSELDSLYGEKTIPLDFANKDIQLAKETLALITPTL